MKLNPNIPCFSLLLWTTLLVTAYSDLASDRKALLSLRAALGGRALSWNLSISPCNWTGVQCVQNRVQELRLPGLGLSGELPVALGNLTELRTLSLRFNDLCGPIPSGFSQLTSLRYLYLQGNRFSGHIPDLFSLPNLVRLNLANNNLEGTIPACVNDLNRLTTLYLENNHFSGSLPDIELPTLVQFNVSFNQLNGTVPKGLSSFSKAAFEGNSLCGEPLVSCSGTESSGTRLSGGAIAGIVVGCVVVVLLVLILLVFLCKRKGAKLSGFSNPAYTAQVESDNRSRDLTGVAKKDTGSDSSGSKKLEFFGNMSRVFDLDDLLRASAEVLGKGTYGTAYKATTESGVVVAVKRLKDVILSEKEFKEMMEVVGSMDHHNLVPVRAYYFGVDEKLLVYDYMPMGSLSAFLHGNRGAGMALNWNTICGIALGAARGIGYLHSQGPLISHGNIKSSNILLTTSYDAHVSDFGLSQLASPTSSTKRVDGYRAPELTDARKISHKADVYSFGIVLLELLTRKAPTHSILSEEGVDFPRCAQTILKEDRTSQVFDPQLLRHQHIKEDLAILLQVAIDCTAQFPDKRPSMSEIIAQIEELNRRSAEKRPSMSEMITLM